MRKILAIFIVLVGLTFGMNTAFAESGSDETYKDGIKLFVNPVKPLNIEFERNKNLSDEQLYNRFEELGEKYELYEPFSREDAEFINIYAESFNPDEVSVAAKKTRSFNKSKSGFGAVVHFHGSVFSDLGIINHAYGGNIKARITAGHSSVEKLTIKITHQAFGLIGGSGSYVGLVHSSNISSSSKKYTSRAIDKKKEYGAVTVVGSNTNAVATVETKKGEFDLFGF